MLILQFCIFLIGMCKWTKCIGKVNSLLYKGISPVLPSKNNIITQKKKVFIQSLKRECRVYNSTLFLKIEMNSDCWSL